MLRINLKEGFRQRCKNSLATSAFHLIA